MVARGAQQYSGTAGGHGQGVTCGSGTSGRGGREGRLLLRVYSNCVALKGMLSRVYSPQVPWSYLVSRDGRLDRAAEQEPPGIC